MTRSTRTLAVVMVLLGLSIPACRLSGSATIATSTVVYQEPPAPKMEPAPESRAGFVWIAGHWESHGSQWTWSDGRYERTRAGQAWVDGRWERRGNSWHWVGGTWSIGPTVRDHRDAPDDTGPTVRDHRN